MLQSREQLDSRSTVFSRSRKQRRMNFRTNSNHGKMTVAACCGAAGMIPDSRDIGYEAGRYMGSLPEWRFIGAM